MARPLASKFATAMSLSRLTECKLCDLTKIYPGL